MEGGIKRKTNSKGPCGWQGGNFDAEDTVGEEDRGRARDWHGCSVQKVGEQQERKSREVMGCRAF
jgi:hypothetical protein